MARKELLHSGEFITQEGDKVTVSFYKKYDIHVSPNELLFGRYGGTAQVSIWSRSGSARLADNAPNWLSYNLAKAELVPGTKWYKYTYNIVCQAAEYATVDTFEWGVNIEDGAGTGVATTSFTVVRGATVSRDVDAEPETFRFNYTAGSGIVTVNYGTGVLTHEINYNVSDNWISLSVLDYPSPGVVRYLLSVPLNTGVARDATITFRVNDGAAYHSTDMISVYQSANENPDPTTITVTPSSIYFGILGNSSIVNVRYTGAIPSFTVEAGWVTVSYYDNPGAENLRYLISTGFHRSGPERFTTVAFYDSSGGYAELTVGQEGMIVPLYATPSELTEPYYAIPYNGYTYGNIAFTVYYMGGLRSTALSSWLYLNEWARDAQYTNKNVTFNPSASRNTTYESRTGIIEFQDDYNTLQYHIAQDAYGTLRVLPGVTYYDVSGNPIWMSTGAQYFTSPTIMMVCPSWASITVSAPLWVSVTVSHLRDLEPDERMVFLSVSSNTTGQSRVGYIDFSYDSYVDRLQVHQD